MALSLPDFPIPLLLCCSALRLSGAPPAWLAPCPARAEPGRPGLAGTPSLISVDERSTAQHAASARPRPSSRESAWLREVLTHLRRATASGVLDKSVKPAEPIRPDPAMMPSARAPRAALIPSLLLAAFATLVLVLLAIATPGKSEKSDSPVV